MPKPRTVLVIDRPGWAFHNIANQIGTRLKQDFSFEVRPYPELKNVTADLAVCFWWRSLEEIVTNNIVRRSAICIYDHFSWCGSAHDLYEFERISDKADVILVGNEKIANMIHDRKLDTRPMFLVEDGVDLKRFYITDYPSTLTFGWCGNARAAHSSIKGLELIREACDKEKVSLKVMDTSSVAALPHVQMVHWFNSISAYICASNEEGTPNPPLEAMACGRPVITTRCGIMNRVLSHDVNGYFVQRSVESIRHAIRKLQSNTTDAIEMGARARLAVEPHSWEHKIPFWRAALLAAAKAAPQQDIE